MEAAVEAVGAATTRAGAAATRLDRDSFEGLGVAVAGLLPHLAVPLAHELLEVPLLTRLGDLALVLLQRLDLEVERGRDVDQVIARGPVRNPYFFDDVRLVALLEEASESTRVARVGIDGGHRRLADREVIRV